MKKFFQIFCFVLLGTTTINAQTSCTGVQQWVSSNVYLGGDQVKLNGELYQANWWSQNQNPENNSGAYQVWTSLGSCTTTPAIVKFVFPLVAPGVTDNFAYWNIGSYPDLDPSSHHIDYTGGQASYNNHHGTDIGLGANGWTRMDAGIVHVIAAADGIIREKLDGEYDRRCTGPVPNGSGNYVKVEHADGAFTIYAHLKNGSVTTKAIGSTVVAGEYLGKVGSSGNSSGPHLHFDVRDSNNNLIDPNHVDLAQSRWITPLDYLPSAMPDIIISDEDISYIDSCSPDGRHDFDSEFFTRKTEFMQGETVRIFRFYNNTRDDQSTFQQLIKPDGSIAWSNTNPITVNWQILIMVSQHILPANAQTGTWTFQEVYNGVTYERTFEVVGEASICSQPTWVTTGVYHSGDEVVYNGLIYRATWNWTQGNDPATASAWGAWTVVGSCGASKLSKESDQEAIHQVTVLPNPAVDQVSIQVDEEEIVNVTLINSNGAQVLTSSSQQIDVNEIPQGVYVLIIETKTNSYREKLTIQ